MTSLSAWFRHFFTRKGWPTPPVSKDSPSPSGDPHMRWTPGAQSQSEVTIGKGRLPLAKVDLDKVIAAAERAMPKETATIAAARDHNEFALALHATLARPGENLFHCPLSIRSALGLLYAGARGRTAQELSAALRASVPGKKFHSDCGGFAPRLAQPSGSAYDLEIASSLWSQPGPPLLSSYIELAASCYEAGVHTVDFSGGGDSVRRMINEWVSLHTKRRIPHLLHPPFPMPATRLVLINAVYFKGLWAYPFEHAQTEEAPFFAENGAEIRVPLMHQLAEVGYRKAPNCQLVSLPYRGATLAMVVLLPDRHGKLSDLEASSAVSMIQEFALSSYRTEVQLFLPRFKLTWGVVDLVGPLRALGIETAFTSRADFSGMNGRAPPDAEALFVANILHKALLEVNEEGTEAAAATATELCFGLADPDVAPPPIFRADHPFLCAIVDTQSGAIMFSGRVADPSRDQ